MRLNRTISHSQSLPRFQGQLRLRLKPLNGHSLDTLPPGTRQMYGRLVNVSAFSILQRLRGIKPVLTEFQNYAPNKPLTFSLDNEFFGIATPEGADLIFPDRLKPLLVKPIQSRFNRFIESDLTPSKPKIVFEFTEPDNPIPNDKKFQSARTKLIAKYRIEYTFKGLMKYIHQMPLFFHSQKRTVKTPAGGNDVISLAAPGRKIR